MERKSNVFISKHIYVAADRNLLYLQPYQESLYISFASLGM